MESPCPTSSQMCPTKQNRGENTYNEGYIMNFLAARNRLGINEQARECRTTDTILGSVKFLKKINFIEIFFNDITFNLDQCVGTEV